MEVYEKILSGNPAMPTFFTRNLSDLIKKLLRSQQGKRLGNTRGGTAAVVKHKWFSSFDWASIENGEAKAPYMPSIKGKDDVTNFDQFDEGDVPVSAVFCVFFVFFLCGVTLCAALRGLQLLQYIVLTLTVNFVFYFSAGQQRLESRPGGISSPIFHSSWFACFGIRRQSSRS